MAQEGILSSYIPTLTYLGSDVLPPQGRSLARIIFYIYLFSPFIFWTFENLPILKIKIRKLLFRNSPDIIRANENTGRAQSPKLNFGRLFHARILLGGYFFLAITFICIYQSV
jgi:hypothetical protein